MEFASRTLRLLCALLVLAGQVQAATFTVITTADSGAGSLRQAVSDASAAGGANTISWDLGSGGVIGLTSVALPVGANTTLDMTNAPSAPTITGPQAVSLGGAVTFGNSNTAQTAVVSAVVSGAGSLTKAGAGELDLTGVNTYLGGTRLNGGVVNINSDSSLGAAAGALTFAGGTLQLKLATPVSSARDISLAGNGTFDTNGNASTLSGIISGPGSFTKGGAGTLTLSPSAANTYTGGTIINSGTLSIGDDSYLGSGGAVTLNGGSLEATNTIISARTFTMSGTGTIDTQTFGVTLGGLVNGGGVLTKEGTGTLTLTGTSNSYGGIIVDKGILNVNSDEALGSSVTLNGTTLQTDTATPGSGAGITTAHPITLSGGGTIDTLGNSSTFSGVISGNGGLNVISGGVVALSGVNTYTGGTTVNIGSILNITADSALGDASGGLTLNGATLQAGGNITSARAIAISGASKFDSNGHDSTLSGVISDGSSSGSLEKFGLGTLTLSALNTYTGATLVSSGTLRLGAQPSPSGSLPAGTVLTVSPLGTFDLQDFRQSVASYSGGGTLAMRLQAAQKQTAGAGLPGTPSLTVTGGANMIGTTLNVTLAPQVIKTGDYFTPIKYGSQLGTASQLTVNSPAAIQFTPDYTSNGGYLTLTASLVPFADSALNSNQTAIGNALEPLRANPTGDAVAVIGTLYTLNATELRAALDQIGPVSLGAMSSLGAAEAGVQSTAVSQRMSALAQGRGGGFSNYTVSRPSPYPGTLFASAEDMGALDKSFRDAGTPWGCFAAGVATSGKLNEASSAAGLQPGFSFNSGGLVAGADYRVDEHFAGGGSLGFLHGHASLHDPAVGTIDNRSLRFGLYGLWFAEDAHANLYVGGAADFFSTNRGIDFSDVARNATATPFGTELNVHPSASYDVRLPWGYGILSPFGALNYDRLMIDGFTESGAGALSLKVGPQTATSAQSTLGLRYSERFIGENVIVIPYGSLGWRRELANQSRTIAAEFASGGGSPFSVQTGDISRDGTVIGAGIALNWESVVFKLDYAGDFRSHYQDSLFNLSFRFKF